MVFKWIYVTTPEKSSEEDYMDCLECLPPRRWIKTGRYETFIEFKLGLEKL